MYDAMADTQLRLLVRAHTAYLVWAAKGEGKQASGAQKTRRLLMLVGMEQAAHRGHPSALPPSSRIDHSGLA